MNTARPELHADWADSMADWAAENAAELKHFTGTPDPRPMVTMQGRPAWPARENSPEMAVYDPSDDDERRERMSPAEAWLLMVVYLLSACFVAWLLAVLAAFFGAVPQ